MPHQLGMFQIVSGIALQPLIEPAPGDLHGPAKRDHGVIRLLRLDEPIPQFDSLAKKAAAFFNISFSIPPHCQASWNLPRC